ncbi:sodium-dependent phosphate transport protein 2B-like isoform X3 [Dermacentor albipictus]|uniref:sodium-dependent phosphate transport protein 2B-like isoform X3 n=1 Tax=Dermacentor albipictus TaxID=60249 RepID=UPI0031FCE677
MEEKPLNAANNATEVAEPSAPVETNNGDAGQPAAPDDRKVAQRSRLNSVPASRRKTKRRSKSPLETDRVGTMSKQDVQMDKEEKGLLCRTSLPQSLESPMETSKSTAEPTREGTPTQSPVQAATVPQPSAAPEPTAAAATSSEPQEQVEKPDDVRDEKGTSPSGPASDRVQVRISVPTSSIRHIMLPGADTTVHSATGTLAHLACLVLAILTFLVSLDVLSSAFKLISGRAAGRAFTNSSVLRNPVVALMIGVLVTVMVQSSSSSTSITVSMVGSNLLSVRNAVPIIMGANVGTSVTNTMISLMHVKRRDEFRRGFAAATVHDIFNWLTVLVLLPIEVAFNMLEKLADSFVHIVDRGQRLETSNYLNALTKPFAKLIVQLDSNVIKDIALGKDNNGTVLKQCCQKNGTECVAKCTALFNWLNMSDAATGACCFALSVLTILLCFFVMVKVLTGLTQSHVVKVLTVCVNREYTFPASMLVGYLCLLLGCLITFVFQSSSAFTSALLPFAALGMLDLERVYPLTLGSNVGTTATGLVAALAGSPVTRQNALQIALCHTFFNVIGILLFYPVPFFRTAFPVAPVE